MKTIAYLKKRCTGNNYAPVKTQINHFDYEILFRLKSEDDLTNNDIKEILSEIEKLLKGKVL